MADRIRLDDMTDDQLDALRDYIARLEAGRDAREAIHEEARDALESAGAGEAHIDDWPELAPAIRRLAAERDALAAAVARVQDLCTVLPPDPGGDAETAAAHAAGWNDAIDRVQNELARTLTPTATEETP